MEGQVGVSPALRDASARPEILSNSRNPCDHGVALRSANSIRGPAKLEMWRAIVANCSFLNRVADDASPDDVMRVLRQRKQFSGFNQYENLSD